MPESIGVAIGTFGDNKWADLARSRAVPSVSAQTEPCPYVHIHGPTLHEARNEAVASLGTKWVICLDADDELDTGYVAAMSAAAEGHLGYWLYQPATLGVYPDGREDVAPVVIPKKDLYTGNFLVISTMFQKSQFVEAGGFQDFPAWEDWDLFIRMTQAGAIPVPVPDAILRIHVTPGSRNQIPDAEAAELHRRILRQYRYVN